MRKLAAIPFLFLYSCIFFEVPNDVIVEPTFSPIDDVSGDYTTETTLLDISEIPCGDNVKSVSDENLTLNFDYTLNKSQADICNWFGEWGSFPAVEGPNPHLLSTDDEPSIVISLSKPVSTFGLELLPNTFGEYQFRVSFYSKNKLIGSITKSTGGDFDLAEGMLFAASTGRIFEKIVVEGSGNEGGIAMAQFRYILK